MLTPCRGLRPIRGKGIAPEPGKIPYLAAVVACCVCRRSALGRRGAEANDARTREVGPRHSSNEAGEQSEGSPLRRRLRGRTQRVSGAKGGGQGTHQHNTYWTQSQARVTNALERILRLSPSHTRGGSRMRESRTYGSGGGRAMNARPYRYNAARSLGARRRGCMAVRCACRATRWKILADRDAGNDISSAQPHQF